MGAQDEWLKKEHAKRAAGEAKVATLTTRAEVEQLALKLLELSADRADVAHRLAKVGEWRMAYSESLSSGAHWNIAHDLLIAFHGARPVTVKSRLEAAREHTHPNRERSYMQQDTLKLLARREKAAAKKAAKA
ncbi:hypothetical protein [Aquincola sp. J276]|uniref:hypothetical protein n=1 Tax=Aquincola sp. J276 TaxID=2898432 RepID=UPI0021513BAB|nr:hypothetical protein [Aquincola sp. J276]MCR5865687.1 hypothetical protein [Aquincola sp. J276]